MSDVSAIEWTDATWNPVTGCTRVSPGCANCYIERTPPFRMAGRRFEIVGQESTTGVQLHPDRLEQPLRWRKPRRVFVCSLADLFHDEIPYEYVRDVFNTMRCCDGGVVAATGRRDPSHVFQVLTKRPERVLDLWRERKLGFTDWPPNVWLGVSIENARYTWRADVLREIPAAVRFISAEPLLGSLFPERCGHACYPMGPPGGSYICGRETGHSGLHRSEYGDGCEWDATHCWIGQDTVGRYSKPLDLTGIGWVIIGGESGPGARPFHLEHAREIIRAAHVACWGCRNLSGEVYSFGGLIGHADDLPCTRPAVFVKQLGASPLATWEVDGHPCSCRQFGIRDRKGGDIDEWPADLRIREFPVVGRAA